MEKNIRMIGVRPEVFKLIEDCRQLLIDENNEYQEIKLSKSFVLKKVCEYFIET